MFITLVFAAVLSATHPVPDAAPDCSVDREALLALPVEAFDQDMQGGWRPLGEQQGCHLAAAELIADYRRVNQPAGRNLLTWHEAQMRANVGQSTAAIALMRQSLQEEGDATGWNAYVEGSIAFLQRDRAGLDEAHAVLAATPPPSGIEVKDGKFNITGPDGNEIAISWPANLDILEAFARCFDKDYLHAYGSQACRYPEKGDGGD